MNSDSSISVNVDYIYRSDVHRVYLTCNVIDKNSLMITMVASVIINCKRTQISAAPEFLLLLMFMRSTRCVLTSAHLTIETEYIYIFHKVRILLPFTVCHSLRRIYFLRGNKCGNWIFHKSAENEFCAQYFNLPALNVLPQSHLAYLVFA